MTGAVLAIKMHLENVVLKIIAQNRNTNPILGSKKKNGTIVQKKINSKTMSGKEAKGQREKLNRYFEAPQVLDLSRREGGGIRIRKFWTQRRKFRSGLLSPTPLRPLDFIKNENKVACGGVLRLEGGNGINIRHLKLHCVPYKKI